MIWLAKSSRLESILTKKMLLMEVNFIRWEKSIKIDSLLFLIQSHQVKQLTLTSGEEVPFNIFHSSWSIYNTFEISKVWFTLIILVQDSVYLSENQEHFDSNSTPSSKRKEEEITYLIDLSSTSKKSCTRSIKIEKVQDANKKRWSILLST